MKIFNKLLRKFGYVHIDEVEKLQFGPNGFSRIFYSDYEKQNVIILKSQYQVPLNIIANIKDPKELTEIIEFEINMRLLNEIKPFIGYRNIRENGNETIVGILKVLKL